MSRSATAVLSTDNLLHNLNVIKAQAPRSKIIAMVKANAYGHGLRSVSSRLAPHVDMLGVASIDEAMALRQIGLTIPILLIEGVFEANELHIAATQGFEVVFHEQLQLEWLNALPASLPPITAWLKVDTGMGRLGFNLPDAPNMYERLSQSPHTKNPVRIISHFACADNPDHPLNQRQITHFKQLIEKIPHADVPLSFANSAAIFQFNTAQHHFIRPGITLYGASPFANTLKISAEDLQLKPVMTLKTQIIAVRHMKKGSPLGYNARYICPEDMPVGVIAFGYGDGYPRNAPDGTPMRVNQTICTLIGQVSMDMITVDLRACPTAKVGDPVILWGEGLPVETVAQHTQQVSYDLLTGVQNRVKFNWQ
jgi:alanine racemase